MKAKLSVRLQNLESSQTLDSYHLTIVLKIFIYGLRYYNPLYRLFVYFLVKRGPSFVILILT